MSTPDFKQREVLFQSLESALKDADKVLVLTKAKHQKRHLESRKAALRSGVEESRTQMEAQRSRFKGQQQGEKMLIQDEQGDFYEI